MSWLESIRNWNYSLEPLMAWVRSTAGFHLEVWGWPAYIGIVLFFIGVGLAFPATRGLTSLIVSGTVRMAFTYIQIVVSLLTVQLTIFVGKLFLAFFHRARRWISDYISRARG